jgi:hypothetical protein
MKNTTTTIVKTLAAFAVMGSLREDVSAATLYSVYYGPGSPITAEADTYYTQDHGSAWDGISTVFHAPVTTSDSGYALNSSLYGRHYDSDPCKPGETGLLDRSTLTDISEPAWLVKHGLAPLTPGSVMSNNHIDGVPHPTEAS